MTLPIARFRRGLPLAFLVISACADGLPETATIGEPLPAYAAVDLQGAEVSLGELRGDVLVVNLWATWCAPCREEMPHLERLHREVGPQGLQVIAVSIDGPRDERLIREFVEDYGLTFTILHDPDQRITRLFNTRGVPETFLIGRDGTLLHRWFGQIDPAEPQIANVILAAVQDGE
jgi:cytochrome c biogenesis protein CcmG, thiol:disulfide interchange protein DsbE